MAAGLYGREPVFTEEMDRFFAACGAAGPRLRAQWHRPAPNPGIDDSSRSQPLLFAIGHALGRVVESWGAGAVMLLGHSIGELAAAALAGVFSVADAGVLMKARAAAMTGAEPGGMLAVAGTPDAVRDLLIPPVAIAAINAPRQTVLAGPEQPLRETGRRLTAAGTTVRRVRSPHAFHSPAVEGAARRFGQAFAGIGLHAPRLTIYSGLTARPVTPAEAAQPWFWAGQMARPVLFWPALKALLDAFGSRPGVVLADATPSGSLACAALRHPALRSGASAAVPLLAARPGRSADDCAVLAAARDRVLALSTRADRPASRAATH